MTIKKLCSYAFIVLMVVCSCSDDANVIDYSEFDSVLAEAKNAADVSKEGESNGDITIGATVILEAVIAQYQTYRETAINQGTLDIATNKISAALDTYLNSIVIIDGSSLESTITSAQTLHDNAVEGVYPEEYEVGSKAILQSVIDAALVVSNNTESTQAEINTALANLLVAINAFEDAENPPLDFTNLEAEITAAQTLHDAAVEGTAIGEYAVGSKATLQTEIDVAQNVVDSTDVLSQADVDAALQALQLAVEDFNLARIGGPDRDITQLTATIANAQAIHDAAVEGTELGTYQIGSKATLQSAIDDAQAVADDISTGQTVVDNAEQTLQEAIAAFKEALQGVYVVSLGGADYIETPTFQGIAGGAQRTMEAWIKTDKSTATTTLILSWGINANREKWDMRINAGKLRIEYSGGGVNGTATINDGQWHHVAVVMSASLDIELYVDGALDGSGAANGIISSTANNFNIGRSTGQPDRHFSGLISDVRIWSVARTASEIADNKDVRLEGNETGLAGYWKLNDGSGTSASDSGTANHTGNFVGNPIWEKITSGLPFSN